MLAPPTLSIMSTNCSLKPPVNILSTQSIFYLLFQMVCGLPREIEHSVMGAQTASCTRGYFTKYSLSEHFVTLAHTLSDDGE